MKTQSNSRKVFVVIATTLNGNPFFSRRGEYLFRHEAKGHVTHWGANGDSAKIEVEIHLKTQSLMAAQE